MGDPEDTRTDDPFAHGRTDRDRQDGPHPDHEASPGRGSARADTDGDHLLDGQEDA